MTREPKPTARKKPPNTNLVFASHFLLFLALGCILYFLIPAFDESFRKFELRPPTSTIFFLQLSQVIVRYWYLAIPLAVLYYFLLLGIRKIDAHRPGFAVFWTILIWYAGAFLLIYLSYSFIIAFQAIVDTPQ
jgi:type II secretory pathway component PulF